MAIRAIVWGENIHERMNAVVGDLYPDGMHEAIARLLRADVGIDAETATLQQAEHGLSEARLAQCDVLLWWGHRDHGAVEDAVVERVARRVWEGMGLIVLHSGHFSKIFKRLMGSPCALSWREAGERERLWVVNPGHPIAAGVGPYFEPFSVPEPLETVFVSWFQGGEVFRSGLTWRRGAGNIFYFRPGHETYPTYHDAMVGKVLRNAVHWTHNAQGKWPHVHDAPNVPVEKALEKIAERGPRLHKPGEAGLR
jgi:trehalose utilization protein